jgi:hypothetical protein
LSVELLWASDLVGAMSRDVVGRYSKLRQNLSLQLSSREQRVAHAGDLIACDSCERANRFCCAGAQAG